MFKDYHPKLQLSNAQPSSGYAGSMRSQETRWLTADEQLAWRTFLTACQTLFATVEGQLLRDLDIPHGYYEILVRLSDAPGRALRMTQLARASTSSKSPLPHACYEILVRLSEAPGRALRMTQLAEASTSSKSRLSHAVARLEERGWVKRMDCATDRRGQIAQLTDEGFAALATAAPGHAEQVRCSLIDRLTPEQVQQLREISDAILADAEPLPEGSEGCGGWATGPGG